MYPYRKKKSKAQEVLANGKYLVQQNFHTAKGIYTARVIAHDNAIWFHKMLNGKTVECGKIWILKEEK